MVLCIVVTLALVYRGVLSQTMPKMALAMLPIVGSANTTFMRTMAGRLVATRIYMADKPLTTPTKLRYVVAYDDMEVATAAKGWPGAYHWLHTSRRVPGCVPGYERVVQAWECGCALTDGASTPTTTKCEDHATVDTCGGSTITN